MYKNQCCLRSPLKHWNSQVIGGVFTCHPRLTLNEILRCRPGSLVLLAPCCRSFSRMPTGLNCDFSFFCGTRGLRNSKQRKKNVWNFWLKFRGCACRIYAACWGAGTPVVVRASSPTATGATSLSGQATSWHAEFACWFLYAATKAWDGWSNSQVAHVSECCPDFNCFWTWLMYLGTFVCAGFVPCCKTTVKMWKKYFNENSLNIGWFAQPTSTHELQLFPRYGADAFGWQILDLFHQSLTSFSQMTQACCGSCAVGLATWAMRLPANALSELQRCTMTSAALNAQLAAKRSFVNHSFLVLDCR